MLVPLSKYNILKIKLIFWYFKRKYVFYKKLRQDAEVILLKCLLTWIGQEPTLALCEKLGQCVEEISLKSPSTRAGIVLSRVGKKPGFFVINRKNPVFWFKPGFFGFYGFNGFFSVCIFLWERTNLCFIIPHVLFPTYEFNNGFPFYKE